MPSFVPRPWLLIPITSVLLMAGTGIGWTLTRPKQPTVPPRKPLPERLSFSDGSHTWRLEARKIGLNPAARQLDLAQAAKALKAIADQASAPAKDAHLLITPDGCVSTMSQMSRSINLSTTLHRLITYTLSANPTEKIKLALEKKEPHITTEMLSKIKGPMTQFVTRFNPGDRPRTTNVRMVTERLNGAIVPSGGVFSFNDHVGPREASEGFQIAHVFSKGKMILDVGGGTCQVSSTLYNAVLLAGLPVVERSNHMFTVPYVVPGRDATVYFGQRDFKFRNTTSAPIYIRALAEGSHMDVTLYGAHKPPYEIEVVSSSSRRGDKVYAQASRLFKVDGKVVKRERLSSDVYTPLALAQRG